MFSCEYSEIFKFTRLPGIGKEIHPFHIRSTYVSDAVAQLNLPKTFIGISYVSFIWMICPLGNFVPPLNFSVTVFILIGESFSRLFVEHDKVL